MRFTPGEFQHNLRVGAALVPSLAVLAGFGGRLPAALLLVSPCPPQAKLRLLA